MVALALLALLGAPAPTFQFNFDSGAGLSITANGLPLVQGSGFQFYAPGWTRGYYSSSYAGQHIDRPDPDTLVVTFAGGPASGKLSYHRSGDTLSIDEEFQWDGDNPALVEVTAAKLWAPAMAAGAFSANGQAKPSLASEPNPKADMMARRIAPDGATLKFAGPWGALSLTPRNTPWFIFDARGYPQEYAVGKSLLWFGLLAQPLPKGTPVHVGFDLSISPGTAAATSPVAVDATPTAEPNAEGAPDDQLPMVPYPKRVALTKGRLDLSARMAFPAVRFFHFDEFLQALTYRFEVPKPSTTLPAMTVDGGIHDMKLPHEAYRIEVRKDGFTVFGQDENGLRHGLRRLALLAFSNGGKLYLPLGTLTDWPSTPWRGVHLFVGPKAQPFQQELMERVLLPLGFNEAVLECERSAWTTLPNIRGGDVMSLDALHELFKLYRKEGIDAIPLVQSFGHMEWFFEKGANLDIAMNAAEPYGVDPRKPRTKEILDQLWNEVVEVTGATTIHFGCDEVDMTGWQSNPQLMTDLWKLQMPTLGNIAKRHQVKMMIWGDMALAPGEAIDATNAPDVAEALARRAAIPPGTMIADWHYKADRQFEHFFPSLQVWKEGGFVPIASTWHEPDNVYGFTVAGVQQGMGVLKTTWTSENSTAEDPIRHFEEYAPLVLSGEYAWSGRQDFPSDLGYDYKELFRRLYFERLTPLKPHKGVGLAVGAGQRLSIGRYRFAPFTPVTLFSALDGTAAPQEVTITAPLTASTLVLACGCSMGGDTGAPVARVTVTLADGSSFVRVLRYGEDLLSVSDGGVVPLAEATDGKYAALITLPKARSPVVSVRVTAANSYSKFAIYGLTGI